MRPSGYKLKTERCHQENVYFLICGDKFGSVGGKMILTDLPKSAGVGDRSANSEQAAGWSLIRNLFLFIIH
jgi:hypothetical protein